MRIIAPLQVLLLTFLLLPIGVSAQQLLQSPIQFRNVDGEIIRTTAMTLNGIEQSARLMPDIDGDGQAEWYFRSQDPVDPECNALTIAMSTQTPGSDFVTADLANMMRVRQSRPVNEDGSVTASCRFITAAGVLDDLNGDGIGEIRIDVFFVVMGSVQPGALIDLSNLNGLDGFEVEEGRRAFSIGDVNGDGFNDFGAPMFGSGTRVYAGQAQLSPLYALEVNDADQMLVDHSSASLSPLGDINGDGFDDVRARPAGIIYGSADINLTSTEVDSINTPVIADCNGRLCEFGAAGDFDNDGFDDVVVSVRDPIDAAGEAAIVYGAASGFPISESVNAIDPSRRTLLFSEAGTNVFNPISEARLVSDLNGDGHDEVLLDTSPGEVVLFSTPGKRLAAIAIDSLDGSDGVVVEPNLTSTGDINYFVNDVDGDGNADLYFSDDYLVGLNFPDPKLPSMESVLRQSPGMVDVFWQAVEGAASYRLSLGNSLLDETSAAVRSYSFVEPDDGAETILTLAAIDASGVALAEVSRRIRAAIDHPWELMVSVHGERLIELFFDPRSTRYLVMRNGELITAARFSRSYVDDTVEPGQQYTYQVIPDFRIPEAGDDLGTYEQSPAYQRFSESVTVTTPGTPSGPPIDPGPEPSTGPNPPLALSGIVYSSSALEIQWDRSTGSEGIDRYQVLRDGTEIANTNGNTFFDTGLSADTAYLYAVIAVDLNGNSSVQSPSVMLTTFDDGNNPDASEPSSSTELSAPTGFRFERYGPDVGELFWDRQAGVGIGYDVYQNESLLDFTDGTSYFVTGLAGENVIEFSVATVDSQGSESALSTVQIGESASVDSPTGVIALVYGPRLVEVFWDRMPAIGTTYNVYVNGQLAHNTDGTSQLLTLDGLTQQIDVQISSVTAADDESSLSAVLNVQIQ